VSVFRQAVLVGGVVGLLALSAAGARASTPEGPRLAFVRFAFKPVSLEVLTSDAAGVQRLTVAGGSKRVRPLPTPLDAPSWSPDGSQIAFSALPGGLSKGSQETKIFVVGVDGTGLREVPGTSGGATPVFAPDGHTIAFSRSRDRTRRTPQGGTRTIFSSATTWLADLNGTAPRRLTPWRNRLRIVPTSFSPDGALLALARSGGRRFPELVAMHLDGSGSVVLARDATDGIFSPDGTGIAFLRLQDHSRAHRSHGGRATVSVETTTDLFTAKSDGSEPRQLTDTPGKLELWPSWDPSGRRLAFARFRGGFLGAIGFGDSILEMNDDGSCPMTVLASRNLAFYGPVWQPGSGREAGPIACAL
jgi:Tol biopolymer transport system component